MTEQLALPLSSVTSSEAVFARVFRRLGVRRPVPDFRVEYFPFAGLRSTIRLRGNLVEVRLSDLLAGAPPLVFEALAEILMARVLLRKPSREARECYLAYVFTPGFRRRVDEARRARGSKRMLPARGHHFDLEAIFRRLNRRFFRGELPAPRLGWSPRRSRTILGHYDSGHGAILINRRMDDPSVPTYVIEYLVFHEMLHMKFPVELDGHRRVVHARKFLEAEKKFPHYEQVRQRLKHLHAV